MWSKFVTCSRFKRQHKGGEAIGLFNEKRNIHLSNEQDMDI